MNAFEDSKKILGFALLVSACVPSSSWWRHHVRSLWLIISKKSNGRLLFVYSAARGLAPQETTIRSILLNGQRLLLTRCIAFLSVWRIIVGYCFSPLLLPFDKFHKTRVVVLSNIHLKPLSFHSKPNEQPCRLVGHAASMSRRRTTKLRRRVVN